MNTKYNISEEFEELIKISKEQEKILSIENALDKINSINKLGKIILNNNSSDKELKVTKRKIKSFDDAEIDIQIIEPQNIESNAPCLIYYHGGGFCIGAQQPHIELSRIYASRVNCKIIFVDYRLSLEYPFPTGVEDCYSTLLWVHDNAKALGIAVNKIAVIGESAGGTLAAAVSQMSIDRNGPEICFQMLIYPATDNRLLTKSIKEFTDTPGINSKMVEFTWSTYLRNGDKGMIEYASPMLRKSFRGLPNAYIEVVEFDPLRDDGINYAKALKNDGICVELVEVKGAIHGYDSISTSNITKESIKRRIKVLKNIFSIK